MWGRSYNSAALLGTTRQNFAVSVVMAMDDSMLFRLSNTPVTMTSLSGYPLLQLDAGRLQVGCGCLPTTISFDKYPIEETITIADSPSNFRKCSIGVGYRAVLCALHQKGSAPIMNVLMAHYRAVDRSALRKQIVSGKKDNKQQGNGN